MSALSMSADVDYFHLKYEQSLKTSLGVIDLARRAGNIHVELNALLTATRVSTQTGEPESVLDSLVSRMSELSERLGDRYWMGSALATTVNLAALRGNWQVSHELGEKNLAMSPNDPIPIAFSAILEYETGNLGQGNQYLERLLEGMAAVTPGPRAAFIYPSIVIGWAAHITGQNNHFDVATEAAQMVLTSPLASPMYPLMARSGLGLMAVFSRDIESAREHYAALVAERKVMIPVAGSADRILGLLAHTIGNLDQAAVHFEEAIEFCRKAGYRSELAWACCDYADILQERDGEGDRDKAVQLLDESLAISSALGMRPLMERVLSRREILKA